MRFEMPDVLDDSVLSREQRKELARVQKANYQAFLEHNQRIRPLLPPALQELIVVDMSDAKIRSLHFSPTASSIGICYVCGDTPQGYFDLTLNYEEVDTTPEQIDLLCMIALEGSAEMDGTEIDVVEMQDGLRFIHRCRWNTNLPVGRRTNDHSRGGAYHTVRPEVEFRFGNLKMLVGPRGEGNYRGIEPVIVALPDSRC